MFETLGKTFEEITTEQMVFTFFISLILGLAIIAGVILIDISVMESVIESEYFVLIVSIIGALIYLTVLFSIGKITQYFKQN